MPDREHKITELIIQIMPLMRREFRVSVDSARLLSDAAYASLVCKLAGTAVNERLRHYAHRHGLIHRDVKPENILFSGGQPYLADFGIARALERAQGEASTTTGLVRGTITRYVKDVLRKFGVSGRTGLVALWLGCQG